MKNDFKKITTIGISVLMISALFTGCSSSSSNTESTTVTEDSSVASDENSTTTKIKERGLQFTISNEYLDKGVELCDYNENVNGYQNVSITYYSPTSKQLLDELLSLDEITEEIGAEYTEKIWATSRTLMEIVMVDTNTYQKLISEGKTPDDFTYNSPSEELATNDEYTYIISIPDLDNGSLSEEEIKEYMECKEYMQEVKENLTFIPVEAESTETVLTDQIPTFNTTDLNGNTITDDVFYKNKLTIVNVWGTFCGPCIDEMPELAEWSSTLPQGVEIIGIVGDIDDIDDTEHLELALQIVEKTGVEFTNIIPSDDFFEIMDGIVGYPTTFFVDTNGSIVGSPIVGADMDEYKQFVEDYLNEN